RNLLSLVSSTDLVSWELVCDLLDYRDADPKYVGFQYVDFFFEGEDLLWLCRTAINGARNFHDANCQTFHRIENYKELIK
ncbi:MAG: exo-alpha-sialidase, partial [Clostridia bacterium]|nr:exo-alpha-sialidase [Clostridia bacterium]